MKKIFLSILCFLFSVVLFAQDSAVAQADREAKGLRADGKIYVVIAVLLTILFGLFIYIIRLDRKITKIENNTLSK